MIKLSGVYRITCSANGRIYIGSSVNILQRWADHRSALRKGLHKSRHLQRAFNKYGLASLKFDFLEICQAEDVISREQYYLNLYRPFGDAGFNSVTLAGSTLGYKHTTETIEKIRVLAIGRRHRPESIVKMSMAQTGLKKRFTKTKKWLDARAIGYWTGKEMCQPLRNKLSASYSRRRSVKCVGADGSLVAVYDSIKAASAAVGMSQSGIFSVLNKSRKSSGGFSWEYA